MESNARSGKDGKYQHIHAYGKYGLWFPDLVKEKGAEIDKCKNLDVREYINNMDLCLAAADLVVCRCGAITLTELQIMGKPSDKADAVATLRMLSGRTHAVYTGVTVIDTFSGRSVFDFEKTEVTFRVLTDREIEHYVENFSVLDKAGSYGIQEYASIFVSKIDGDYFNIVGLPLCKLATMIYEEYGEELV